MVDGANSTAYILAKAACQSQVGGLNYVSVVKVSLDFPASVNAFEFLMIRECGTKSGVVIFRSR